MMKKEHLIGLALFLAGVVFAPQVRKLPVLNKLPTI
jgi:hypothetical protein